MCDIMHQSAFWILSCLVWGQFASLLLAYAVGLSQVTWKKMIRCLSALQFWVSPIISTTAVGKLEHSWSSFPRSVGIFREFWNGRVLWLMCNNNKETKKKKNTHKKERHKKKKKRRRKQKKKKTPKFDLNLHGNYRFFQPHCCEGKE